MTGLLLFVLFIFAALAWWRLLQGKEVARAAAASACKEHGLLLMDDTVVLEGIEMPKNSPTRTYGLSYRFDFAHEGILRTGGKVLVSPGQAIRVIISTSSGELIEEIE